MIIKPKFRGFICTTAHPAGCAKQVEEQVRFIKKQPTFEGPKNVLVIGASTGYGLASRIATTFGSGAATVGVFFEKPPVSGRTGTAGWYNSAAFEQEAKAAGYRAFSINGDAFSKQIKEETIECIRRELGRVDCVVYSLASPKRVHPETEDVFSSVIKPTDREYTNKTIDVHTGEVSELTIQPATPEEVTHTIAVMGGEDWKLWMDALGAAGVLAEGITTVAFSYIGPEMTHPIYRNGTIGKAKDHLEQTALELSEKLSALNGRAFLSVNKALVTQSSSAIPIVPLYISLLYKIMKEKNLHEGCIEQMYRLFTDRLYSGDSVEVDSQGRIRVDDLEMREDVQREVLSAWENISTQNIDELSDLKGYREEFFRLFGFGVSGIDYDEDVDPEVRVASLQK